MGVLDGWFTRYATSEILSAVDSVAAALGGARRTELIHSDKARAAAFCITAAEGARDTFPCCELVLSISITPHAVA